MNVGHGSQQKERGVTDNVCVPGEKERMKEESLCVCRATRERKRERNRERERESVCVCVVLCVLRQYDSVSGMNVNGKSESGRVRVCARVSVNPSKSDDGSLG
jgi:hypothetical protein